MRIIARTEEQEIVRGHRGNVVDVFHRFRALHLKDQVALAIARGEVLRRGNLGEFSVPIAAVESPSPRGKNRHVSTIARASSPLAAWGIMIPVASASHGLMSSLLDPLPTRTIASMSYSLAARTQCSMSRQSVGTCSLQSQITNAPASPASSTTAGCVMLIFQADSRTSFAISRRAE
jgi:hypothetical protein